MAVQARIPHKFNRYQVVIAARALGVRPQADATDPATTDARYCEWVPAAKLFLYNQDWIDRLVNELSDPDRYQALLGRPAACDPPVTEGLRQRRISKPLRRAGLMERSWPPSSPK